MPLKEPTVYHIAQLRKVLQACNRDVPTEELVVRLLVGSGMRRAEVCGLAVVGPDCLPDLMTDSLSRGRVELRARWDAGANGRQARRVPHHVQAGCGSQALRGATSSRDRGRQLLINEHGNSTRVAGSRR